MQWYFSFRVFDPFIQNALVLVNTKFEVFWPVQIVKKTIFEPKIHIKPMNHKFTNIFCASQVIFK